MPKRVLFSLNESPGRLCVVPYIPSSKRQQDATDYERGGLGEKGRRGGLALGGLYS